MHLELNLCFKLLYPYLPKQSMAPTDYSRFNFNYNKKKAMSGQDEMISSIAAIEDHESKFVLQDTINYLFKKEPADTKTMAVLHFVDGLTYKQVSVETGLSEAGVRKRLSTFKEKIKKLKDSTLN